MFLLFNWSGAWSTFVCFLSIGHNCLEVYPNVLSMYLAGVANCCSVSFCTCEFARIMASYSTYFGVLKVELCLTSKWAMHLRFIPWSKELCYGVERWSFVAILDVRKVQAFVTWEYINWQDIMLTIWFGLKDHSGPIVLDIYMYSMSLV